MMRGTLPVKAPDVLVCSAVELLKDVTTPAHAEAVVDDEIFKYIGRSVSLSLMEQGYVQTVREDIDDSYMVMAHYNFQSSDAESVHNPFLEIHTDVDSLTMGISSDPSFKASTMIFNGMDDYIRNIHRQVRAGHDGRKAMPELHDLGHVDNEGRLNFKDTVHNAPELVTVSQAEDGEVIAFDSDTPHCAPRVPEGVVRVFYGFLL